MNFAKFGKLIVCAILLMATHSLKSQSDFLFIIDNSGSISPTEFDQFSNIIEATGLTISQDCPESKFAIMHYGGSFGQEFQIQNDFVPWTSTSPVSRAFVDCITSGTPDCGDDLNFAFGHVNNELGNNLNLTPGNELVVVIFTDADGTSFTGVNMSPCAFASCSTIMPTTNFNTFIGNYPMSSSYVVGVADTDNEMLLNNYVYGNGTYTPIDLNDPPASAAAAFIDDVECESPALGLAKDLIDLTDNNDGTFTVEFLLTVENLSQTISITDLEIFDNILSQFGTYSPSNFSASNGSLTASLSWNGTATSNILSAGQSIAAGQTETVSIQFDLDHCGDAATIANIANVEGKDDENQTVTDQSTNGQNPDPNNNGSAEESVATSVQLPETPRLGIAKQLTNLTNNLDGSYTVEFLFTIENFSSFSINSLAVFDNVLSQFGTYSPSNFSASNGSLTASPSWNGSAASNILSAGQSIASGNTETVRVSFDITPSGVMSTIFNSASVQGITPGNISITDLSYVGTNPDPDNNDCPTEDMPTPVVLPEFAMISGIIWKDSNLNGIRESGENGMSGVQVMLRDCSANLVRTTSTDMNGNYAFSNVFPGSFEIFIDPSNLPPNCNLTIPNAGFNDAIDSDILANGRSNCLNIGSADDVKIDGGIYPPGSIGLAKDLSNLTENTDGTLEIEFLFTIENFSNYPITNLMLFDDIFFQFANQFPSNFMAIDGSLTANPSWSGLATSNILAPGQNIAIGGIETVSIKFKIIPDGVTDELENIATVKGEDPIGGIIEDESTNGVDPDPNNDGTPPENTPTPVPLPQFGKIGNFVFEDCNGNGMISFGENGLADVEVKLFNSNGNLERTVFTDNNGFYLFDELRAGNYYIEFVAPNGYESTSPYEGNAFVDSNVDGTFGPGTTALLSLSSNECLETIDAGFYQCVSIGDQVFYDFNKNDIFDIHENGINGIPVELLRLENGSFVVVQETVSQHKTGTASDDGWFKFCAPPGTYKVRFKIPQIGLVPVIKDANGFQSLTSGSESTIDSDINRFDNTTNSFTITCGQEVCSIGAGYYPMAQFGNRVWLDSNADGIQNGAEVGVAGVKVNAYNADDQLISSSTTNNTGEYSINYLGKDDYYLEFIPSTGYFFTNPDLGDDQTDSDVSNENGYGTTRLYSLNPGDNLETVDAGLVMGVVVLNWMEFDAFANENHNHLIWKTSEEINTDFFEIERKLGENSTFQKVGVVSAANVLGVNTYEYLDRDVTVGRYYYRLKQFDLDGNYTYSKTIVLDRNKSDHIRIAVYPNPSSEFINIELMDIEEAYLDLYNIEGKKMRMIFEGKVSDNLKISIREIPPGTYFIRGTLDDERIEKKIIKQ